MARPSHLRATMKAMGRTALDVHFDRSSPIPMMDPNGLTPTAETPVVLPPLEALGVGNQDVRGLLQLVAMGRRVKARNVFEIGTYNGITAWVLAKNLPEATVHTLDIPPEDEPTLPLTGPDRANLSHFADERFYAGTAEASRIVQHLCDSAAFDFSPFHGRFDLVYIDGAHSFEYVKNDSEAALRLASPPAALVWDDYWRQVPDVARYLHTRSDLPLRRLPSSRLVGCLIDGP